MNTDRLVIKKFGLGESVDQMYKCALDRFIFLAGSSICVTPDPLTPRIFNLGGRKSYQNYSNQNYEILLQDIHQIEIKIPHSFRYFKGILPFVSVKK